MAKTVAAAVLAVVLSTLFGLLTSSLLRACGVLASSFSPYDGIGGGAYWVGVAVITWAALVRILRDADPDDVWRAVWLGWSLAGVATAFAAPGLAYVWVVPSLAAAVLTCFSVDRRWLSVAAVLATALIVVPTLYLLGAALGAKAGGPLCGLFAVSMTPLYPLLAGKLLASKAN